MYELIKEFIKPELLILIPVLYIIGVGLKKSNVIANKRIPLFLGLMGVVLALLYIGATNYPADLPGALLMVFTGITQGILAAGASVYVNQLVKQSGKDT